MNAKWVKSNQKYVSGEILVVNNRITIGSYFWDGGGPPVNEEGEKLHYRIHFTLPGLKIKNTHFLTSEEAKKELEKIYTFWLTAMNLIEKGE